ncbi:DNA polymerase III subunit beta [Candidatus Gottesmanbacteria bacterium]|nr:DNA polymerase III subunit beta [Candidatus Gottesmanbacteria bacterium]
MKASILQENLARAVSRTNRIVSSKPALPILSHLLLVAKKEGLLVTASTVETTEEVFVGAKTEKEGGLCVPAKIFSELVSSLPQDAVTIEEKEGSLLVSCGGARATVAGMSAGEFPPAKKEAGKDDKKAAKKNVTIKKDALVSILSFVLFAAATDDGRPLLTGVKIVQKEEGALFAATDGYRLSTYQSSLVFGPATDILVPGRALAEVLRVCQEEKEAGDPTLSDDGSGDLVIVVGDTTIVTRRIDGQYPNFEKIIPTGHTTTAAPDKEALMKAVKSASIFARDSANIVRLRITKNTLTISANAPQVGENAVTLDARTEGDDGDIAFNSRFLLELLANFPGEELTFEMTGSLNPGAFRSPKDPRLLHIIMPVRVSSG